MTSLLFSVLTITTVGWMSGPFQVAGAGPNVRARNHESRITCVSHVFAHVIVGAEYLAVGRSLRGRTGWCWFLHNVG